MKIVSARVYSPGDMSKLHTLVNENFSHAQYGRLLHHPDPQNPTVLHYSVQLNDSESLAWEPIHCDHQKDTGRIEIWSIDWHRFQPANWVKHLEKKQIRKALHISIDHFHQRWQYELFRFNCEHWARLVTTGDCRCFQIHEFKKLQQIPVIGIIAVAAVGFATGAWEHNGYAQDLIEKNLSNF